MRNIPALVVILMIFTLPCMPVSGLTEPVPRDDADLDGVNEMLERMTSQSEEMLNQSQKEYEVAKYGSDMPYNNLEDFEALMAEFEQLINFMTDLMESVTTIIDHINSFTNKISTQMPGGSNEQ